MPAHTLPLSSAHSVGLQVRMSDILFTGFLMRIRSSRRTPYLSRRDQFRLAVFAALMGVVVLAIQRAGDPASWYCLTGHPRQQEHQAHKQTPSHSKVDFSVDADEELTSDNTVRIVDNTPAGETILQAELSISPQRLTVIQDNSVGIRDSERDLYYELLARVRDAPTEKLELAARDDVAFPVLMNESSKYIGQLLTVEGELRRLQPYPFGQNEHGINQLYEAWLKTLDAGDNPYRILCTRIPAGIPEGMNIEPGTLVRVTGYYFKRYGYPAQENRLHVAPLILARDIHWFSSRKTSRSIPDDGGVVPYVLVLAGFMGTVITLLLWQFRRSDRQFERQHLERLTAPARGAIESLNGMETVDVADALRQLAEMETGDSSSPGGEQTESRQSAAEPPEEERKP